MAKNISKTEIPVVLHDVIKVVKNGDDCIVRIMLVMYDGIIEVYYQEEGYPFEFAYGVGSSEGFKETLRKAQTNVYNWGLHYEE